MSYVFDSRLGERLYQLMPEVYRTRDNNLGKTQGVELSGDLARYLDAHGQLLDLIHATLEQQLRDVSPATSQDWLIPYFAQLVAANIVSPDSAGKHAEVMNAVSWRQRKGTLKCVEEIAEAVGQMEVEIQEGWQRVAITPRVDRPVRPYKSWDSTLEIDVRNPFSAIRHPALPAAMVDLRRPSRAVESEPGNPASRQSNFAGIRQTWRQINRHGAPCFPGSYEDVSRRTVDLRTADANNGRYHPRRLLAYTPPPPGLIPFEPIKITWAQRLESLYAHLIDEKQVNGVWTMRNRTDRVIEIQDNVELVLKPEIRPGETIEINLYRIEGINFKRKLSLESGGRLELEKVEAARIDVDTPVFDKPAVIATDCLFHKLSSGGLVQLESCSVLGPAFLTMIKARNSMLMDIRGSNVTGLLEFSCYPESAPLSSKKMNIEDSTTDEPVFFARQRSLVARAVLAPGTSATIHRGASDGGEIGYFHSGRAGRPVLIEKNFTGARALSVPAGNRYPLQDLIFAGVVVISAGNLELIRTAAKSLTINTGFSTDVDGAAVPALDARDCLFDMVTVGNGLARFEYCTVMQAANCKQLQASDSIFAGAITDAAGAEPESGCVRYSRVPQGLTGTELNLHPGLADTNTRQAPVFIKLDRCDAGGHTLLTAEFGQPGYGVLDPATAEAIRFGAEDGGEMGVGHHRYYSLKAEAMLDKIREFLPIGIDPVLIHDPRLLRVPPEIKHSTSGET